MRRWQIGVGEETLAHLDDFVDDNLGPRETAQGLQLFWGINAAEFFNGSG